MTPETAEHLDKAREYLSKARNLLYVMHYNDEAGRDYETGRGSVVPLERVEAAIATTIRLVEVVAVLLA